VADANDASVLHADVRLDHAEHGIEDERIGDDQVERLRVDGGGRLAHAVADDLAASERDLVAVTAALRDEIALDFDEEVAVGEADLVAGGGPVHFGVLTAREVQGHGRTGQGLGGNERLNFARGFIGTREITSRSHVPSGST